MNPVDVLKNMKKFIIEHKGYSDENSLIQCYFTQRDCKILEYVLNHNLFAWNSFYVKYSIFMLFMKLGLFVEPVLIRASLVLDDSIDGIENLLVGFGVARTISVENLITDYHKWNATNILAEIFTEFFHKSLIVFVAPNLERININFVFGFGW